MYRTETKALEDGEIAVVVDEVTGQARAIRYGDGTTAGGVTWLDKDYVLRTCPIKTLASGSDYFLTLGGQAVYSNGAIAMITPTSVYSSNAIGVVTITLASAQYRIESVSPAISKYFVDHVTAIADDRLSATITAAHMEDPPGMTASRFCTLESLVVQAYEDPSAMGTTQDTRGLVVLCDHPEAISGSYSNQLDYRPITMGWYDANVQSAVAEWSDHNADSTVNIRAGARFTDNILPTVKGFDLNYGVGGFLSLRHSGSGGDSSVMDIEAIDPTPYISSITAASGSVATLVWSTNGVSGNWTVLTCTNLVGAVWTNAVILATNTAPAGYISMTASNAQHAGGGGVFFKVSSDGEAQDAVVRFTPPVRAPRFEFAEGVYLFWSNSALWVHSGGSNGVVGVTW